MTGYVSVNSGTEVAEHGCMTESETPKGDVKARCEKADLGLGTDNSNTSFYVLRDHWHLSNTLQSARQDIGLLQGDDFGKRCYPIVHHLRQFGEKKK